MLHLSGQGSTIARSVRVHSGIRNRPTLTKPVARKYSESLTLDDNWEHMAKRWELHPPSRLNSQRSSWNYQHFRTQRDPQRWRAMESHGMPWMPWMQWTPCYFWSFTKPFLVLPRLDTFILLVAAWIHRFCWLLLGGEVVKIKRLHIEKCVPCRIISCSCQAIGLLTLALPRGLACDVYIKVTHTSHTCQHVHGIRGYHWFPIWTYPEKCRRYRHLHFPAACPHSVAQDTEANDPSHREALCNHWSTTILSAIRKVLALPQCATRITISVLLLAIWIHIGPIGPYWALLLI